VNDHNLLQKGRPLIMRLRQLTLQSFQMYCPKCGDVLKEEGRMFLCERGRMELSQFMAERLYSGFVTKMRSLKTSALRRQATASAGSGSVPDAAS
jgi:hypothetical protein